MNEKWRRSQLYMNWKQSLVKRMTEPKFLFRETSYTSTTQRSDETTTAKEKRMKTMNELWKQRRKRVVSVLKTSIDVALIKWQSRHVITATHINHGRIHQIPAMCCEDSRDKVKKIVAFATHLYSGVDSVLHRLRQTGNSRPSSTNLWEHDA